MRTRGLIKRFLSAMVFQSAALLMLCPAIIAASAEGPGGTVKDSRGNTITYPETKKIAVTDTLHGNRITDVYRWLEKPDDPAVGTWLEMQSALTRSVLNGISCRAAIRKRLEALSTIGMVEVPQVKGARYFFEKREGAQNQPIVYWREGPFGEPKVLLDPNNLSSEGIIGIDWWYPSQDGRIVAYGLSEDGSEESTLYLINVDTGELLPDAIPRTRGSSVAWLPDGSGFYYSRFPNPGNVPRGEENFHGRIRFHRIGSEPANDPTVFGEGRDMRDWLSCDISDDGTFLIIHAYRGARITELFLRNLSEATDSFACVSGGAEAHFYGSIAEGDLYIRTDDGAPNYRVFKVAASNPTRANWKEIIPETNSRLDAIQLIGHRLYVSSIENASSRLSEYDTEGRHLKNIATPGIGTVRGISGPWNGNEVYFGFVSFLTPSTVYRYDISEEVVASYDEVASPIDAAPYLTEQVWCRSKDGTRIPMFIVRRRDTVLDGRNPVILYGYGGFEVSMTPSFLRNMLPWLESGGVYALANLRGGGEFGRKWHEAGMLERKQNVFDDYIAAAEWLWAKKYTSPARLALFGGSNGGLLVAATVTQRPDLCRAAVCAVPVLDMLRYHRFSIGRYWMTEYGDPDDPSQFKFLFRYSPYHHVRAGARYPAILFTTAESDSRVDPIHAMKMTALLQAENASDNPILLRYEAKAGHGIGAPAAKVVDEYADILSFLCWQLGVNVK